MNLFQIYSNPVERKTGDNYILVGEKMGSIINPVYIDQFGNLYVPFGTLKFDYQGRYWYVGEMLICYGTADASVTNPDSVGFTSIKYDEKKRVRYVGKMRVGYDYYGRVSYLGEDMPVNYSGSGYNTQISSIGYNSYYPNFNASEKFYR